MQIEIQDYHRDQLEKDGISLPTREETVLTISGNFTQKDLDKAAKKGTKRQSSRSETIAAPTIEKSLDSEGWNDEIATTFAFKEGNRISFDEMLQALAIQKTEIKALSEAQNQTQFDYVKQRIFEQTGGIWEWEGAPKDGKWVKVDDATIADPSIEKSLNGKGLSDTIAATAKPKITYKLNRDGSVILRSLRGITLKALKRMTDAELKAIGLVKTLIGANEKFFPTDEALSLRYQEKELAKSNADKRFTADEAAKYYSEKSGKSLSMSSLRTNAKKYGFMIKEKGSGLYALIDS
ncbi:MULTISPECIES: hypothetical protein [Pseudanabaena]|uniref:Uncharacterized protein n=2 Tax=Pseudanabaena TaxID=1152 RepID=L8N6U4_9CYAN|nr:MULTISPECIES: hypothetical protein [Pseudanabaena]ELS34824.1 hypothetical protein Pse7429DRAFT_0013 [Pseudanabaena biceps PCC 7429]MDG3492947.1 hypothetical protein [Pseudanabaena catenata USMAC16]